MEYRPGYLVAALSALAAGVFLIGYHAGSVNADVDSDALDHADLLLAPAEGFRGEPYTDTRGFQTIGYGTRLPLTENEALALMRYRLNRAAEAVRKDWPAIDRLPSDVRAHLYAAAYQLGADGLLGFKDMREALDQRNWGAAARAALTSKWARETPHRAQDLAAAILRAGGNQTPAK